MPYPNKLERGWVKYDLIRELALMEKSQAQLATQFGVSGAAVSYFAKRHKAEIDAAKARMEDEFAAIPIANKRNRLAEYQQIVDDIAELEREGAVSSRAWRAKMAALKSVAEELGHLPNRITIQGTFDTHTRYTIDGVDPEDLT